MRNMVVLAFLILVVSGCTTIPRHATLADGFAAINRGDSHAALEIYESIAHQHPDTMEGALAIDAAIELSGRRLFPQPSYECSADALASYTEAERQYVAGAMEAALAGYQDAVELCPNNANWWVHSGDAYFGMGDYEHAKTLYLRGLQLDPWNRGGYRFLADAELRLGNGVEAYQSAVLAVVSDPTYEAGWQFLRELTRTLGGQWNRRVESKPRIEEENGKLTIVLSPVYESKASLTAWLAYGAIRWRFVKGPSEEKNAEGEEPPTKLISPEQWSRMSPLDRERFLVSKALDIYRKFTSENPATKAVFWETFDRATQAGLTDEAIYMHLMDRELAPNYPSYRAQHASRLIEYVTKIIAPVPSFGSRRA